MTYYIKLKELIALFEKWLPDPEDATQIQQWTEAAAALAHSFEFSDREQRYIDRIIEMYAEQFTCYLERSSSALSQPLEAPMRAYLEELLQRKQTEQRTPEWYAQMGTIISASELGNLFASPRQRAKLVASKALPYQPRNQPLAVTSDRMSAFDWGIRFEPVVKQIYEDKYGVTVKELGRMHHPADPRCTASPDGLVYHCPKGERAGRLIEIKCPVTREVDGIIPKDYYTQMQMQLHVTGLTHCDYIEAVFASKYNNMEVKEGPGWYSGIVAVVRYAEKAEEPVESMDTEDAVVETRNIPPVSVQDFYYAYSPLHCEETWIPPLKEGEELVELIPWRLLLWSEQGVKRSEEWWVALQPMIHTFWEDVERAKRGEFTIPESTRAPKRKKEEPCRIVFHKLDEQGEAIEVVGSPSKKPFIPASDDVAMLDLASA